MDAIVLAGGLGTRLRSVVADVPKPMAPVCGQPFLQHVLDGLLAQGVRSAVLAVGYKHETIRDHFGDRYKQLNVVYSVEDQPLGTGGALRQAMTCTAGPHVLIVNGDTLFRTDVRRLEAAHLAYGADLTVALKPMRRFDRYGTVELRSDGRIAGFHEKRYCENGLINGGVYIGRTNMWDRFELPGVFSFERFLEQTGTAALAMFGVPDDGYFIDIGVPEDYSRAQTELIPSEADGKGADDR